MIRSTFWNWALGENELFPFGQENSTVCWTQFQINSWSIHLSTGTSVSSRLDNAAIASSSLFLLSKIAFKWCYSINSSKLTGLHQHTYLKLFHMVALDRWSKRHSMEVPMPDFWISWKCAASALGKAQLALHFPMDIGGIFIQKSGIEVHWRGLLPVCIHYRKNT